MREIRRKSSTPTSRIEFVGVQMVHDPFAVEFTCCRGLLVLIWDSGLTQSLVSSPSTGIQYCGYSHLAHGLANQLMVLANPLGSPCSLPVYPVYGCLGTGSKLPFRAADG